MNNRTNYVQQKLKSALAFSVSLPKNKKLFCGYLGFRKLTSSSLTFSFEEFSRTYTKNEDTYKWILKSTLRYSEGVDSYYKVFYFTSVTPAKFLIKENVDSFLLSIEEFNHAAYVRVTTIEKETSEVEKAKRLLLNLGYTIKNPK